MEGGRERGGWGGGDREGGNGEGETGREEGNGEGEMGRVATGREGKEEGKHIECLGGMRLHFFLTLFTRATLGTPASSYYNSLLQDRIKHSAYRFPPGVYFIIYQRPPPCS